MIIHKLLLYIIKHYKVFKLLYESLFNQVVCMLGV